MQVPHHHHFHAFRYLISERKQFHRVKSFTVKRQYRQCFVRIHFCITMPREMLRASNDTAILHAFHVCTSIGSHFVSVFSKRTSVYHRVLWIDIYVHYGRIVDMDIHHLALFRHRQTHFIYQRVRWQCPQLHLLREEWKFSKTH